MILAATAPPAGAPPPAPGAPDDREIATVLGVKRNRPSIDEGQPYDHGDTLIEAEERRERRMIEIEQEAETQDGERSAGWRKKRRIEFTAQSLMSPLRGF